MDTVRVAIIGAGSLANSVHYPALTSLGNVEIVGICDLDSARLASTAERFGIDQTFTNYRAMLDSLSPDAVYALMPPHVLFDIAMDVLERRHHLFIEKPPAITTFQTQCLARVASQNDLVTGVGFQRRYHPLVYACWEEVCKSGPIHQVISCFYKNVAPATPHPYYRGAIDILRCDAIHAVDSLRYYSGLADVVNVSAEIRELDCWYGASFNALVSFENGVVGALLTNWRTGRRLLKLEFHAYGASAYVDADGTGSVYRDNEKRPCFEATASGLVGSDANHISQGFLAESAAFIEAIRSGHKLHNSIEDSVKTMELVDLIYENAVRH
ncbi:MAG: Gfo/Idh/MocA family oxidoreductase [Chloroflexi bacterium]|nr:Gfo/Idh/MocA family oxidoreductase [Chloroflexota bacterium]